MLDMQEVKNKIVSFIEDNGPSLPVKIAKSIDMSPVFASAILSELIKEGRIKTSHLKIGASSLYLLSGQEKRLEEYSGFLKSVEREALIKLQSKKILEDEQQEPATRVALRSIKDFATPFRIEDKIMWKYSFTPKEEIQTIQGPKEEKPKIEKENQIPVKKVEAQTKERFLPPFDQQTNQEFYNEIKKFVEKKEGKITEEIQIDKKEIIVKIEVPSTLGKIKFLLIAKDKKSVTTDEINNAFQRAIYERISCLYIIRKEPPKKIQTILESNDIIKLEVLR
jgi:hypothetical protein